MIAALLLLAGGFGLLLVGAEILVRSAAALALRLGISPLIVGLTVVSLGTSSPELVVSLQAALQGASGVAIGNVVGSNICNIGLVLGLSALIRPLAAQVQLIRLDVPVMIASSVVLFGLLIDSRVSRLEAVPLLLGIAVYVFNTIRQSRRESRAATARVAASTPHLRIAGVRLGLDLLLIGSGLALLAWGSDLFVEAAVRLAELLGVSRTVVGLTVVAFGTSLPELVTSVVAAIRKHADLAIGNIIGSNIFNSLGILGTVGVVRPLTSPDIGVVDLAVMTGLAILMLPLMRTGYRLSRWEGAVLLAAYLIYLYHLVP